MARIIDAFTQFFDDNGEPLADGFLKFLESGTNNTDKDTFADINEVIANANPLQLDGAGRCPNVFGSGAYNVISYAEDPNNPGNPGQQFQQFDPVSGDQVSGAFSDWNSQTIYDSGDIVTATDGNYYRSLVSNNQNQEPSISSGQWEEVKLVQIWNINVTYSAGDSIYGSDGFTYVSNIDSNLGNNPTTDDTNWSATAPRTQAGIIYASATNQTKELAVGNDGQVLSTGVAGASLSYWAPSGYIAGLTLSNDTDTDHDINITSGEATDSSSGYILKLTSEITKQIDAIWAVGDDAGGLFTSSVAVDTWYHIFLIRKDSDGTVDAGFDTSVTAANIPVGYTAYKWIGAVLTDGSSNINPFIHSSSKPNDFFFDGHKHDVSQAATSVSRTLHTLSVPLGFEMEAIVVATTDSDGGSDYALISSPYETDIAVDSSTGNIVSAQANTGPYPAGQEMRVVTNLLSQIGSRGQVTLNINIKTRGWSVDRGSV